MDTLVHSANSTFTIRRVQGEQIVSKENTHHKTKEILYLETLQCKCWKLQKCSMPKGGTPNSSCFLPKCFMFPWIFGSLYNFDTHPQMLEKSIASRNELAKNWKGAGFWDWVCFPHLPQASNYLKEIPFNTQDLTMEAAWTNYLSPSQLDAVGRWPAVFLRSLPPTISNDVLSLAWAEAEKHGPWKLVFIGNSCSKPFQLLGWFQSGYT